MDDPDIRSFSWSAGLVGDEPLAFVQSGYCGDDVVVAIDPATGATVWPTPPDVAVGEQTIDSEVIASVFGNVLVTQVVQPDQLSTVGLDIATGEPKWTIGVAWSWQRRRRRSSCGHCARASSV